jgi:predicted RND superfamily exporter protein
VFPAGDSDNNEVMEEFVAAVRQVAPNATGPAIQILESGRAVANAFRTASWLALTSMAILLFLVLRRPWDVGLVLAPLLAAALTTAALCQLAGLDLNFANVIALPLLLGIGVAFNIYFVINWRSGISLPLSTATARAVLFSAATAGASFGSLAASSHPGTAGMGLLLLIGLAVTLAAAFTLLPALMGPAPRAG